LGSELLWQPAANSKPIRSPEDFLLGRGSVTQAQLDSAVRQQSSRPHLSVLELLIESKAVSEVQAYEALAVHFRLPFTRITASQVQPGAMEKLPLDYLKAKKVLPLRMEGDATVVGVSNPADIFVIDDLKRRLGGEVLLAVAPASDIVESINELAHGSSVRVEDIIKDAAEDVVSVVDEQTEEIGDLERIAGESPVIRYVNYLVSSAVTMEASDIHIEPFENLLRVRYRMDGLLNEQRSPPYGMHAAIVSRLKIMANLDISERRVPQDGRIRVAVRGRNVDLRVSILPTTHGEKCVIRVLDARSVQVGLEHLGMSPDTLEAYQRQVLQPHGIVLVTGPTGSGKSTTLYSTLKVMDLDTLNVSTVEDPVEYQLKYITQVHVNEAVGMTFSAALRSLLRQDPDVIMIGEIRDAETARIAVQASLTGHLVLATLHTNDAPSSITRLIDIGVEPYLIGASLNGVLAQRLVRRICSNCKAPVKEIDPAVRAFLERGGVQAEALFAGRGCDRCRQTGYKGRLGVYEMLEVNEPLRELISRNPPLGDLRRFAHEAGMRSLREDGLQKVAAGLTSVEEIMRATET
jgi:type IV pilus assembly protein PilB